MVIFIRVLTVVMFMGVGWSTDVHGQSIAQETNFLQEIYRQLVSREENFRVPCNAQIAVFYEDSPNDLLTEVLPIKHNTSNDFDFLRYSIKQADIKFKKEQKQEHTAKFSFQVQYYDQVSDLQEVDIRVSNILKELRLGLDAPEVKVRKIHDYIVRRSNFYVGDGRNGAADALIKRSAGSRGYALLTYKMLYEAGVPVRIVEGVLNSRPHLWNLVQLDGQWYHLDTSADDMNTNDVIPIQYQFFLIGSDTGGKTHQLGDLYYSVDFGENIVISQKDHEKRKQLILAGQMAQTREKSGIGVFDEPYNSFSDAVLDNVYRCNDEVSNKILDALGSVFNF